MSNPPLVTFKKGPSRRPAQSRRQRSPSPGTSSAPAPAATASTTVVRPAKHSIANPLVQGSKRRRGPTAEGQDDHGGGLDELDYKADESLTKKGDELVTRANDWDLESGDQVDQTDKKKVRLNEDGDIDDGLYRGAANYLSTINKSQSALERKNMMAPIKATSHIRTITLMDYQPDVCKDYKETGFCGYGDSCKFLHDRGDYLAGWQLDKLAPEEGAGAVVQEEDEEEEVPFACLICRKPFDQPVVTKCGHYFCMGCATKRFQKHPRCYACGAPTSGIFTIADKVIAKIEARNKVKREQKAERDREEGGDAGIVFGDGGGSESDVE